MSKKKILAILTGTATVATAIAAYEAKKKADKTTYEANLIEPIKKRKRGIYEKYIKRALDVICATGAIVVFSPVYLGVAVLVKLKLGSPVLFTQDRPGLIGKDGRETVFKMYKFRTMTDERDENGELLPDEARLTKFGKWLRNTSLDELPEAFNILNGTMSVIGPRPQLVRDINYQCVNEILTKERKKSENYLLNAIEAAGGSEIDKDNSVDRRNTPCCGCGACQYVCPVQAIKMDNSCGFKKASVNRKICLNCGKCVNVCPFIGRQESKKICDGKLLSYKDNDRAVLLRSSSGGIAYRIAYQGIISGCYIVGCKFNKEQLKAETILIKDKESINELQGSKYLQSSNFNQIIKKVQDADKNIILFGTPCQIAGIKKIFGDKKDIIYVDLICHGVPSQSVM